MLHSKIIYILQKEKKKKEDSWFLVCSGNRDQTPEKGKREKNERFKHKWKEETGREEVIWSCVQQESPHSPGTAGDVVGDGCNLVGTRDEPALTTELNFDTAKPQQRTEHHQNSLNQQDVRGFLMAVTTASKVQKIPPNQPKSRAESTCFQCLHNRRVLAFPVV